MSFRDANGNYIGGCGAQIGGFLMIPVMALIITYWSIIWRILLYAALAFVVYVIIYNIVKNIKEKRKSQSN